MVKEKKQLDFLAHSGRSFTTVDWFFSNWNKYTSQIALSGFL